LELIPGLKTTIHICFNESTHLLMMVKPYVLQNSFNQGFIIFRENEMFSWKQVCLTHRFFLENIVLPKNYKWIISAFARKTTKCFLGYFKYTQTRRVNGKSVPDWVLQMKHLNAGTF